MAGSWKRVPLAEIAEFTSKPRELRLTDYKAIPFVPMELIPSDKIAIDGFLMKDPSVISSGTFFKEGDILLPKITPSFENGKQAIAEDLPLPFGLATTEVIPLREKANISDKLFLFYFLLKGDVRQSLASRMEGTTGRQRLNTEALKTLPVPLPPLPEQRAIAHVLRAVQEVMQALRRELELERERKAALMHHLFRYGTRGEPTKQTEIGEIPQSWEVASLGTFLTDPPQYGLSTPGNQKGQYPILRMNNLSDGKINFLDLQYVDLKEDVFNRFKLYKEDILFNRTNSYELIGKTAIFEEDGDFVFASYLMRIKIKKGTILPDYLNFYMNYPITQQRLKSLATRGVSQANISSGQLILFKIVYPPALEEQSQIAQILRQSDLKIAALERELALYQELFHALLEELMSGRLSVQPLLEQEPA